MSDALLVHLSDLHFCQSKDRDPGSRFRASLFQAIADVVKEAAPARVGVAITGDLVDSSETPAETISAAFSAFLRDLREAVGQAPVVLLPGNHDRRGSGIFAPWSTRAMDHIAHAMAGDPHVFVHAPTADEPLARHLPALSEVLNAHVVAYDSTHAVDGRFSAGGMFRTEDLLAVPGIVASDRPVVLLLHHHLVPTPVTDVGAVDTSHAPWPQQMFVGHFLPWLVSFADREELFMTALGAGTALTLLNALGSPTLVLHGHKHYPTARLLRAVQSGDGDVLVASAGSAGVLEHYRALGPIERTFLWASFNAIFFRGGEVEIETVFFSPKGTRPNVRQSIARAMRNGASWDAAPVRAPKPSEVLASSDDAEFRLEPGRQGVWDVTCTRRVITPAKSAKFYVEPIESLPRAEITGDAVTIEPNGQAMLSIHAVETAETSYRARGGIVRTVAEARRLAPGDGFSPFASVCLKVRRGARSARLVLRGLPNAAAITFGTLTDLNTGHKRPVPLQEIEDGVALVVPSCPARRLLRIHWPLERGS
ncbi:metallophosphoesterase [Pendulispora albinea]|uniref:Metallophosphoesterase n=1 Tax=Pendulispora albinea TaxID=2741071 RepID=A0ABZ2M2Q5_9BACT